MEKRIMNYLETKVTELRANGGVVPATWLPYLEAIKILCEVADGLVTSGGEADKILKEIIIAIEAAEAV